MPLAVEDVKRTIDDLGHAFELFKTANDQQIKEIKEKGHSDPLLTEKIDKANADLQKLVEAKSRMETEINFVKTVMQRPAGSSKIENKENKDLEDPLNTDEYKTAFQKYLRKGQEGMSAAEIKSLSAGITTEGGITARPELATEIYLMILLESPIRSISNVVQTSRGSIELLDETGDFEAQWVAEEAARIETGTPTVTRRLITPWEMYSEPKITQQLLDDSVFDMEKYIATGVARAFARKESAGFISGNGVGQPLGVLDPTNGVKRLPTGTAGVLTADNLIDAHYDLYPYDQTLDTFLMHPTTVGMVRRLKDITGRYIWEPGLMLNAPATIIGRPVLADTYMPLVAAGNSPVVVGNFNRGYWVVDRIGIRTLRDPYSAKPFIEFYTTRRVGGSPVRAFSLRVVTT